MSFSINRRIRFSNYHPRKTLDTLAAFHRFKKLLFQDFWLIEITLMVSLDISML